MNNSPSFTLPSIVKRSKGAGKLSLISSLLFEKAFFLSSNRFMRSLIGPLSTVCGLNRPLALAGSSFPYSSGSSSLRNHLLNAVSIKADPHFAPELLVKFPESWVSLTFGCRGFLQFQIRLDPFHLVRHHVNSATSCIGQDEAVVFLQRISLYIDPFRDICVTHVQKLDSRGLKISNRKI